MQSESLDIFIAWAFLMFILLLTGFFIIDDGNVFKKLKQHLCKLNIHKMSTTRQGQRVKTYRCKRCSFTRRHPKLKILDGGNRQGDNKFDF